MNNKLDVVIIGAGAAGMMCAIQAAQRGRTVSIVDHSSKLAEKIRISGGGRCNFTNLNCKPENYISSNPDFCRSALARFTPNQFTSWLAENSITFHEKKLGQLFCDEGSNIIISFLKQQCDISGVKLLMSCNIDEIEHFEGFKVKTSLGNFHTQSLVIATGGLSVPKTGATSFGYKIANQFGLPVTKLKPGLVPLSFHPDEWVDFSNIAGISIDATISFGMQSFRENLLITHRGLSGPAILQISSYWDHGQPLHIDLLPDHDMHDLLPRHRDSNVLLFNFLGKYLAKRFVEVWMTQLSNKNIQYESFTRNVPINQYSEKELTKIADHIHDWQIIPTGTLGYAKAEVTCGGVDTHSISSKTMQSYDVPGLYFIGEVMDVTGQLGGYNFQWAWASGYTAGISC